MKKILYFVITSILFVACNSDNKKQFTINGDFKNGHGERIFLAELHPNKVITIDSTIINNNDKFSFTGNTESPKFYLLKTKDEKYISLILENRKKVFIKANFNDYPHTYTIEGSDDSRLIKKIRFNLENTISQLDDIAKEFKQSIGKENFDEIKKELRKKSIELKNKHKAFSINIINNNPKSIAMLTALYQQIAPGSNLFDPKKDYKYFEKVDSCLSQNFPNTEITKTFHKQVLNISSKINAQISLDNKVSIGFKAPEIALPTPNGDTISLSSLEGKYILLNFWASWCIPCRTETPKLIKIYKKYKNKGFEIYQVSLDRKEESWKNAIKKDNLNWINVSDLKFWDSAPAKIYNIRSIPTNFLINKKGIIIAKNLRGEALEIKLSELFN